MFWRESKGSAIRFEDSICLSWAWRLSCVTFNGLNRAIKVWDSHLKIDLIRNCIRWFRILVCFSFSTYHTHTFAWQSHDRIEWKKKIVEFFHINHRNMWRTNDNNFNAQTAIPIAFGLVHNLCGFFGHSASKVELIVSIVPLSSQIFVSYNSLSSNKYRAWWCVVGLTLKHTSGYASVVIFGR